MSESTLLQTLPVFQDLSVTAEREALMCVVSTIEASLDKGWERDTQREAKIRRGQDDAGTYCFTCTTTEQRQAAAVWLFMRAGQSELVVGNITPIATNELSIDAYNAILQDFYAHLVIPAAEACGAQATLSHDALTLEEWLSPRAAELLQLFSHTANKSTGSSHPLDRQRWEAFVVATHRDRVQVDTTLLLRWLVELEGWPDDVAGDLVVEYEQGRSLLASYDAA